VGISDRGVEAFRLPLYPGSQPADGKSSRSRRAKPKLPLPPPASLIRGDGAPFAMFIDTGGIWNTYDWDYLGLEKLGKRDAWTFQLTPLSCAGPGAFSGKIWVVDGDILRFSGTFAAPGQDSIYAHFDSWRYRLADGKVVPFITYYDQTGVPPYGPESPVFRARALYWGFGPRSNDSTHMQIEGQGGTAPSSGAAPPDAEDVYLEAEKALVDWLQYWRLVPPSGDVEQNVCGHVIQKILYVNDLRLDRDLSCRIILTTPIEATLWESVIGVSKGVFDLAPNEATLALVLCREIAAVVVRKKHLDLAWGRHEILNRGPLDLLRFIRMPLPQDERDKADDLAIELFGNLNYPAKEVETASIFLNSASEACKTMPALFEPRFGDGLPGCGREAHISRMAMRAPPGSMSDPALNIGAHIVIHPWTNLVSYMPAVQQNSPWIVVPGGNLPVDELDATGPRSVPPPPYPQLPRWVPPPTFSTATNKKDRHK